MAEELLNESTTASSLSLWEKLQNAEFGVLPPIGGYAPMWWQIFLYVIASSLIVHGVSALIAYCCLRKHKIGRFYALMVIFMGFIGPVTGGAITTAVMAWIYWNHSKEMPAFYACAAGIAQTLIVILLSFTRILATL